MPCRRYLDLSSARRLLFSQRSGAFEVDLGIDDEGTRGRSYRKACI